MAVIPIGAAGAISVKPMKAGGLPKGQALMAIADAARLPGYGGTFCEGCVVLAAGNRFIAATPGISLGCEFYMPYHALIGDVPVERIENRAGHVIVPTGPRPGIEASLRENARIIAEA